MVTVYVRKVSRFIALQVDTATAASLRLVQFWLNLPYKCYLILLMYNFYVLLLIFYMFYSQLTYQIRIKFDFASIFCQMYVLLYYNTKSVVYVMGVKFV